MENKKVSLLEEYFTEEVFRDMKEELQNTSSGPLFNRFYKLCKFCMGKDDIWDDCSARIVYLYCWLIDHDKKDELCKLLKVYPFWGIYAPEEDELAPLCYAISRHKTEIAKAMIDLQAPEYRFHVWENYQPGYMAIKVQQYEIIRYLLDHGVKEDFFAGPYTGLQYAAQLSDLTAAKIFVEEYHHDVNKTVVYKTPALNTAVKKGDLSMVLFLLEQPGIDVNKPGADGKNAVEHAVSDAIRNVLLHSGAEPSSENTKLICAAVEAAIDNETEYLNALTEKIVSIENAKAVSGDFDLLYHTVKFDQLAATRLIVENNLIDLKNYNQNLFWLCGCVFRKDRHKRRIEEKLVYMRLFEQYGYHFNFPKDSYEHQMALYTIEEEPESELKKEARAIMQHAGVLIELEGRKKMK